MKLTIVAAMAANRVIGRNNKLPWHLPSDLKHFKELTSGGTMILGRNTFESFGCRPLPKRNHIVLSRRNLNISPDYADCVFQAHNPNEAISAAHRITNGNVFVIGGAIVYEHFIDRIDSMVLTELREDFEGDTHFPYFERSEWEITNERIPPDAEIPYRIRTYERRNG